MLVRNVRHVWDRSRRWRRIASRYIVSNLEEGKGKVAVVTGASRGIGRAVALALGSAGCTVVVNYAHNDKLAWEVVECINERRHCADAAVVLKADCSNEADVKEMFSNISSTFGQIDILVRVQIMLMVHSNVVFIQLIS